MTHTVVLQEDMSAAQIQPAVDLFRPIPPYESKEIFSSLLYLFIYLSIYLFIYLFAYKFAKSR